MRHCKLRRVVIESPYAGDVDRNVEYARRCVHHSIHQNEAPLASHLLYTQPGILNDNTPIERQVGMEAGWAWIRYSDALVAYCDYGITPGMQRAMEIAAYMGLPIERRNIGKNPEG